MAERLDRIANGFMEAKVLLTGAELRLFERIGHGASAGDLARSIGADLRALEILLDALTAMGVLTKTDGIYNVHPEAGPLLAEDSPDPFAAMLRHRNLMFRNWARLEDRIRGEGIPDPGRRPQLSDPRANENFIRAMVSSARRSAEAVAARLDFGDVRTIADVGGGPGRFLLEFLRRAPGAEGYLVDLPLTLEVARRLLEREREWARIRLVSWNVYADPPPTTLPRFDLVFVSQLVHAEGPAANRTLFSRLAATVEPGGTLVVHEHVVGPDRTEPAAAALFAVNMLAMTPEGRTYTEDEIASWGAEAGFRKERFERLHERSALLVFRR